MTVAELIAALSTHPPDHPVALLDLDTGYLIQPRVVVAGDFVCVTGDYREQIAETPAHRERRRRYY